MPSNRTFQKYAPLRRTRAIIHHPHVINAGFTTPVQDPRVADLRRDWIEEAATLVRLSIQSGMLRELTSDLFHEMFYEPQHNSWFGGLTAKLKAEGWIVEVGRVASTRPEANARKITKFACQIP